MDKNYDTGKVTDVNSVSDIMKNGNGMMFDSLGGEFKLDPSQVTVFSEEQKQQGLTFLTNIFDSVINEVSSLSTYPPTKEGKDFVDRYKLTQNEIHFIKKVLPNKVFYLKKIPSVHFVKLSSGKFINAETYVYRLESGLINLNKKYGDQSKRLIEQLSLVKKLDDLRIAHEKLTSFELFKLAFRKLLRRA